MDYLLCWRGWLENGEDRTVNIFTVSFFGHRIIPEFREAEDRVEALVHALLLEKEYVEFLIGRDGDFDQIVSSAVKRQKRIVRDDNSSLIWILPYPTAELHNNTENFEAYYDEIEICGSAASSHPKGAFQIRNRQMVKRSDLVVFYVSCVEFCFEQAVNASTITNINEIINNDFFIITSIFYLHNEQSGLLQG